MNPWRAALTSATASGKSTRMASRSAIACSSTPPLRLHLLQRRRGQLDGGVERERRELLALSLLHALGLLLGELTQAAHQIVGIAAERESEASTAFHAARVATTTYADADARRFLAPEPPLRARMVEEVDELGWAIHDWIDVEALTPDRPEELGRRIVGFRLPLSFVIAPDFF